MRTRARRSGLHRTHRALRGVARLAPLVRLLATRARADERAARGGKDRPRRASVVGRDGRQRGRIGACGIWLGRRSLAAVLVDGGGRTCFTATVARTDAARSGLAQRLAAVGADLVVDESHLPADPIAFAARRAGVAVWVAGPPLVGSLRALTGAARGPPKASAALLARLPSVPWLRSLLRRLEPEDDPRQVPLL